MASLNVTVIYTGKSGKNYTFSCFTTDHVFASKKGGVYLFSKREVKDGKGSQTILYFGKAKVFNERLDSHEKWDAAKKSGCNCIGIYETDSEDASLEAEKDILLNNNTPLNTQHNS